MRTTRAALAASLLLAAALLAACAARGAGNAASGVSFGGLDRLLIRQHTDVLGVVAGNRSVFALTTSGVISYDRVFSRWRTADARLVEELQFAGLDGTRISALAADPVEDAAWIGIPGAVVLYRVAASQVQRITVPGVPQSIAFARGNSADAYVLASGQWLRVSRAGFVTPLRAPDVPLVPPVQLDDVYRQHPTLRGQLPFLLRDASDHTGGLLNVRISAGTMSPDRLSEVWVGTLGDGLWLLDATFQQATPLRYGLLDESIGAIALGAGGVWSAGDGRARRAGLSYVSNDATQFVWRTHDVGASLDRTRVRDLAVRGSDAWLATDRGVWRMRLGASPALTQWDMSDGLADNAVRALLPRTGGVWVGTRRGLSFLAETDAGSAERAQSPGNARENARDAMVITRTASLAAAVVNDLAVANETLLIATTTGLFARAAAPRDTTNARRFSGGARLNRSIEALATSDTVVLVVTDRDAHLLDASQLGLIGASAPASLEAMQWPTIDVREIGPVVAASVDSRTAWIAGARGVIAWSRDSQVARVLRAGREIPLDVRDIVVDDTWTWIGTAQGLVRVRRARDGGLP